MPVTFTKEPSFAGKEENKAKTQYISLNNRRG